MLSSPHFALDLLSRIEDAGLNASAPPQQRWVDGWLVRFSPGKAKRARCINAVARGRLPLAQRLSLCEAIYRESELPLLVRLTPFSEPATLDRDLAALGLPQIDGTRVMVRSVATELEPAPLPADCRLNSVGPDVFAEAVGLLRGSPHAQRQAHALRLMLSPVAFVGHLVRNADGTVIACGQMAFEAGLVGLYDIFTTPCQRGRGVAKALCAKMLATARARGADAAYLQVEADNSAARRIYSRMGFTDAYAYHYRGGEELSK
jgi:ribosomal protein S18 acetylase RimI-like enzyme